MADILADKKNILIFGANGFIGTALSQSLISKGYVVSGYGMGGKPQGIDFCHYYNKNLIEDEELVEEVSQNDAIVYLISTTAPASSMTNINDAYSKDIPMLLKVLEAARSNSINRIVFASSGGTVYGQTSGFNKETDPCCPLCNYGISKLACEKILIMYNKLYRMENLILRISNPFGFGQNPKSGVGVVTAFANAAKIGDEINILGNKTNVRDMVRIDYVIEAFELALNWNFRTSESPVFNIGSGVGVSIVEVLEMVQTTIERELQVKILPPRNFDVGHSVLDVSKAMKVLGYKPPENIKADILTYIEKIVRD